MKFTISRKLLFSYLVMALLTVLASAYAVISLRSLHDLAYRIANQDFIIVETSKKMMDRLLAQESAERKYLILKDSSLADIFRARNQEFAQSLQELQRHVFPGLSKRLPQMLSLNGQYGVLFEQEVTLVGENRLPEAVALSERDSKRVIEDLASQVRAVQRQAEQDIDHQMQLIRERSTNASRMTLILSMMSLAAGLTLALLVTYNISMPLRKLEKATTLVAEGQFDHDLQISNRDEIGSLARTFGRMTERLKELETLNLDASPLTGLPGNLAIERKIAERLSTGQPFSLCQIDLDNFKPFADKYGYAWASEIIKEVARILMDDLKQSGGKDVFVGHIGGDDFVIIADPRQAESLSRHLVDQFDARVPLYYSNEDRQQGFILGQDRRGNKQAFPLLTVSVAMVTGDGHRFKNALEIAELAAELKEYAKTLPGSNFVRERHDAPGDEAGGVR
jgi:GGDEF domain-containing protein/CHASE3 domain sensor protein